MDTAERDPCLPNCAWYNFNMNRVDTEPAGLRFTLFRLFAACIAASLGLLHFTYIEVSQYGGGLFPILCIVAASVLLIIAAGLLLRRVGDFLIRAALLALEVLSVM